VRFSVPSSFKLAGMTWTVIQVPGLDNLGETHRDALKIELREELTPAIKKQTFLHELLHAIWFTMGDEEGGEEKDVEAFAQLLYQALSTMK
jgi:hypothetical protein